MQVQSDDAVSYSERAREIVIEQMRTKGLASDQLSVVLIGEPIILPHHTHLHTTESTGQRQFSEQTQAQTRTKVEFASALVLTAALQQEQVVQLCLVRLGSEKPDVDCAEDFGLSDTPFSLTEYHRVSSELAPAYEAALDITRGPERFYPYLPSNIRSHFRYPGEKFWLLISDSVAEQLSDAELHEFASLMLDLVAHYIWMDFEGYDDPERLFEGLEDVPETTEGVRKTMRVMRDALSRIRSVLNALGVLQPDHMNAVKPYLCRAFGQGMLLKLKNTERLGGPSAPAVLYATRLGVPAFFVRLQGRLVLTFLATAD